jgi:hypothetical protein
MRCHFIPACTFVLSCLVGFASPAVMADSPAATAERFVEAWNSHDKGAFVSLFTEDAYWVPVVDVRLDGNALLLLAVVKQIDGWCIAAGQLTKPGSTQMPQR